MRHLKHYTSISILLFLLLSLPYVTLANQEKTGYKIDIQIDNMEPGDTIMLAHYVNTNVFPNDTITLNKKGQGVFQGDEALPGGMYLIFIPKNQMRFEFLVDQNQHFSMQADVNDPVSLLDFDNSLINERFAEYQQTLHDMKQSRDVLQSQIKETDDKEKKDKLQEELKQVNESVETYMKEVKKENKDNFLGTFLYALSEVETPDFPRDEEGHILDSAFQYKYFKNHYFDFFDIGDARLMRTPIYENKIKRYLNQVVPQSPDSLIKAIDFILEESRQDSNVYRFNLVRLFNHYAQSKIMGMDAVHVHIAENYYIPDAHWSDENFIAKLQTYVEEVKPTLIGQVAPDMEMLIVPDEHFRLAKEDTTVQNNVHAGRISSLHQLDAPYTVVIFWEKDCGHCRKALKTLYEVWTDQLKAHDVQVIAFHTLFGKEGKIKWIEHVNKEGYYGWLNAWYPYGYQFKKDYNLKSTPQIFILDENKKILAKRVGAEQAADIIMMMIKKEPTQQ